jgi:thymidylate synthase
MKLNLIYATSVYHCIGNKKGLIWNIKDELDYFYQLTSKPNSVLIVGRTTYELIIHKLKNDNNNRSYILFSNTIKEIENGVVYNNIHKCINDIYNDKMYQDKTFWVIGGKQIYELFEPYVDAIYKSYIHLYHKVDSYSNNSDYIYYSHNENYTELLSNITKKGYDNLSKQDYDIDYKVYVKKLNHDINNHYLHSEYIYLQILNKTLQSEKRLTRNGFVYSYFGDQMRIDVSKSLPIITTKKMFIRGIIEELLFFIKGHTNTLLLEQKNINIWKGNSNKEFLQEMKLPYEEGDIGPMYGFQWRHYNAEYTNCNEDYTNKGYDQMEYVIQEILTNPNSRRIIMTTYHPTDALKSALFPCHSLILQFYIENIKSETNSYYNISLHMYQRSADVFLGLPFNITSTSLLLYIICYECNRRSNNAKYYPKDIIISFGDIHLYEEHKELAIKQLKRKPLTNAICKINKNCIKPYDKLEYEDFDIKNYYSYDSMKTIMK